MQPELLYLICTQPRSGSWLLSEALESTNLAGYPQEYYAEVYVEKRVKEWGVSTPTEYQAKILETGTTPNGVFGLKFHWYQFDIFLKQFREISGNHDLPAHRIVASAFPNVRYIRLQRRDTVRQAISYYKAIQTQTWWDIDGCVPEENRLAGQALPFDYDAIARLQKLLLAQEANWRQYFDNAGIVPYTVFFEDFVSRYEETVIEVLDYLQIAHPTPFAIPPPRLKRQADVQTDEWVRLYHQCQQGVTSR